MNNKSDINVDKEYESSHEDLEFNKNKIIKIKEEKKVKREKRLPFEAVRDRIHLKGDLAT